MTRKVVAFPFDSGVGFQSAAASSTSAASDSTRTTFFFRFSATDFLPVVSIWRSVARA